MDRAEEFALKWLRLECDGKGPFLNVTEGPHLGSYCRGCVESLGDAMREYARMDHEELSLKILDLEARLMCHTPPVDPNEGPH